MAFRRRAGALPLLVLALVALSVRERGVEAVRLPDPHALSMVSLNLAMREDVDAIFSELSSIDDVMAADVLLLQEVARRDDETDIASRLADRLGMMAEYRDAFAPDAGRMVGLALLSRYPIEDVRVLPLKHFDLSFRSRSRIALGARLETPEGPVRFYNVHLDTRINRGQREEQLAAVVRDAANAGGPAVIAGDFNTNNNLWLFHTIPLPFIGRQASGVERFMFDRGFRSAFARGRPTHDTLRMQLDWMFLRGLEPLDIAIHPLDISDHHALVASVVPAGSLTATQP